MEQLFSLPCLYLQTKCVYLLWYYREISNKQLLQKRNPFAHLPPYGSQYKHNIQHIVYSHTYYSLKGAIMLENNSFAFLAYATAYAKKPLPCDNRLATSGLKCSTFMHGFNYAESNICWHVNRCYTKGARLETFYDLWEMETPTLCPINDEALKVYLLRFHKLIARELLHRLALPFGLGQRTHVMRQKAGNF